MRRAVFILALTAMTPALARAQRASYEELQTFSAVMNLIRLNHVDSVSYTPLVRAAIEGALGAVDPHSRYVRRDIEAQLIAARSGEAGSAGVELDGMGSVVAVIAVGSGSPAEQADMLGRQQIASVPTALSELFKERFGTEALRYAAVSVVPRPRCSGCRRPCCSSTRCACWTPSTS